MTNDRQDTQVVEKPNRWIGPLILLVVVLAPIVVLIVSNTETSTIEWAQYEWDGPRWLVLTITFVAGIIGGKLFGWVWRAWRRRRRRLAQEAEVLRRHAVEEAQ